jgi:hypothetical protein
MNSPAVECRLDRYADYPSAWSELNDKMVLAVGGRQAVCLNGGDFHGWVMWRTDGDKWASLRPAHPDEVRDAQERLRVLAVVAEIATTE